MIIENANANDVNAVVDVHLNAFPGFFLTNLGRPFLRELYLSFLQHSSAIFIVAKNEDKIVGFAAGTSDPELFFVELRSKKKFVFLCKALPSIFRNPIPVARKLLYAVRYRGERPKIDLSGALLSSIGVVNSFRGTGVAPRLLSAFESEVKSRGVELIYLTTDAVCNERVNSFYMKHGYDPSDRFLQNGSREMIRYVKKLHQL